MSSLLKDNFVDESKISPLEKKRKIDKEDDSSKTSEQNGSGENCDNTEKVKDTKDDESTEPTTDGLIGQLEGLDSQDTFPMLEWNDGVGTLPGSDIRFRKTEFGTLEIITGDSDVENETDKKEDHPNGNTNEWKTKIKSPTDNDGPNEDDSGSFNSKSSQASDGSPTVKPKRKYKKRARKSDDLLKCEMCGCYGLRSEFCSSGRFCSQRCVGAYASKCRAEALAVTATSTPTNDPPKKKRKKGKKSLKGGEPGLSLDGFVEKKPIKGLSPDGFSKKKSLKGLSPDGFRRKKFRRYSADELNSSKSSLIGGYPDKKKKSKDDASFFYSAVGFNQEFEWDLYLSITGTSAVPEDVFKTENPGLDAFPKAATEFKQGMKMEAVDPKHPSCFCVVSVVEIQGARLRLHFDGWSESYDFWINAGSPFLFPPRWCKKNGQKLQPPRGIRDEDFEWDTYLANVKSEPAPDRLFREIPESTHGFTTNMKLEAVDKKNPDLTCVSSVTNVIGEYFLIHFDEWDDTYDYWCISNCPFLHPIGWCKENGIRLTPPQDDQVDTFNWQEYLEQTNSIDVPLELLQEHKPPSYPIGNKFEVVDPRNSSLIRVATVAEVDDCQMKIHFDGWDDMYDLWFDADSSDLHPVGYCNSTGHALEIPPSSQDAQDTTLCPTPGCRGIGHVKGAKYTTHHSIFGCPYSPHNVQRGSPLVDRLASNSMGEEPSIASRVYGKQPRNLSGTTPENEALDEPPPTPNKSEMIKQHKLLKRVIGRPAKKAHEKVSAKTARLLGRPTTKFEIKEKSKKLLKRRFSNPGEQRDSLPLQTEIPHRLPPPSGVPGSSLGNRGRMSSLMPRVKILQQQQQLIRQQNNRIFGWTIDDVFDFIRSIGLPDHAMRFHEQQIDGQALLLMSQADMIHHLRINLGPALKISHAVSKL